MQPRLICPLRIACLSSFVTGLVDTRQKATHKRSMYEIAEEIGLPASFVELRHQVTHDELPSVTVLRHAVNRSLAWLWDHYWQRIDEQTGQLKDDKTSTNNDVPVSKETYKDIFRPYIKWKIKQAREKKGNGEESRLSKATSGTTSQEKEMIDRACRRCVRICRGNTKTMAVLASALLDTRFMIPANRTYVFLVILPCSVILDVFPTSSFSSTRNPDLTLQSVNHRLGSSLTAAFQLWDPILKTLGAHQLPFLNVLVSELVSRLTLPSDVDVYLDAGYEGIYLWLKHILFDRAWISCRERRKRHLVTSKDDQEGPDTSGEESYEDKVNNRKEKSLDWDSIIAACLNGQNTWSLKLMEMMVLDQRNINWVSRGELREVRENWADLVERALEEHHLNRETAMAVIED